MFARRADPRKSFFLSEVGRPSPRCLLPAKPLINASRLRYALPERHAATYMTRKAVRRAAFPFALAHASELAIDRPQDLALLSWPGQEFGGKMQCD